MKLKTRIFGRNFYYLTSFPIDKDVKDYYAIILRCNNCEHETYVYIKKGVQVNDIISAIKCEYCDCRLQKRSQND